VNVLELNIDKNKCMTDIFRGCLVGLQIGDAMGMPVSGWLNQDIKDQFGTLDFMACGLLPRGEYTDDTQQAFAIAEALCKSRRFDGAQISRQFIEKFEIKRNYDIATVKAIEALESGFTWLESGVSTFYSKRSYGNTAASRVAPLALLYFDQPEKLNECAVLSSRITHVHPLGIEGARWQAYAVSYAVHLAKWGKKLDPFAFCDFIEAKTDNEQYLRKLSIIRKFLKTRPSINQVISDLGCDSEALQSVPTALYSFLAYEGDFKSAVVFAVNLGGDADAIGAMAGALCGAYCGLKNIPQNWVAALKDKGRDAVSLSTKLWKLWMVQESSKRDKSSWRLSRI